MQRATFLPLLESLCVSDTLSVFRAAKALGFRLIKRKGQRLAFRPGATKHSPLIVCHADTVVNGGDGPHPFSYSAESDTVTSIALDDRLGIACMLSAVDASLPLASCAMLICDDEEIGNSSARVFSLDITPNFLVELDRRGTDVVCYEYETRLLRSLLTHAGFRIGRGSFSDICYLGIYGVCGFNVGVGYHNEHSHKCHAVLADTFSQLGKLDQFLAKFGDVRLDWSESDSQRDYFDDYHYGAISPTKSKGISGFSGTLDWTRKYDF